MYQASFLMNSEQYCEDLDETVHQKVMVLNSSLQKFILIFILNGGTDYINYCFVLFRYVI